MSKRRKGDPKERRPQKRKEPLPVLPPVPTKALAIVVGLPQAVQGQVEAWVAGALGKPVRVIPIAASGDDNKPYTQTQIEQVLGNVILYAQKKRAAQQQPAPSSILLLYVPGASQEPLLTAFDFFVFPIALTALSQFHEGRQLRHDPDAVRAALQAALAEDGEPMQTFEAVQARVKAVRDAEVLQMPPLNFHLGRDRRMAEHFLAVRRGDVAWDAPIAGLQEQAFDKRRLPRLRGGVTKRAYQDARDLVFLRADLLAHHGPGRQVEEDEADQDAAGGANGDDAVQDAATLHLRGAFRFGAPLDSGFHHDVQLEGGRTLETIVFECARKGPRRSKHTYVNIYPNDVLRGRKLAAP